MALAAASIARYYRFFQQKNARTVLDFGAGKLRNARFLFAAGFRVYAADVPEQVQNIRRLSAQSDLAGLFETQDLGRCRLGVDLVLSTYVLNIIPDGAEKATYLANAAGNLRPGGYLLVEVRCRREHEECGNGCTHLRKCQGCAKRYSIGELDCQVAPYGFRRVCHYYRRHALAAVYQLHTAAESEGRPGDEIVPPNAVRR